MALIKVSDLMAEQVPATNETTVGWRMRRATAGKATNYIALSTTYVGVRVHFFGKRSVPCLRSGCVPCSPPHCNAPRWKGYVLAQDYGSKENVIFEFTPNAVSVFQNALAQHGTLRGFKFNAMREGKKENGPVVCVDRGWFASPLELPPSDDIWRVLAHIWSITLDASPVATSGDTLITPAEKAQPRKPARKSSTPADPLAMPAAMSQVLAEAAHTNNSNHD